jgi:polar amino acid transport system permease protein
MIFDFDFAWSILPQLLKASLVTVEATLAGFAVALLVGLVLALARRSGSAWVRWPTVGFVEFVRSTPLLVQLYFLYFVLPQVGITLSPFVTGVIGLGLHYSCYTAEVYRAGLESVPRGQWEAATSVNYSRTQTYFRIILPQAIPPIVPPLGNYLIAMFKDTPILAAITLTELMYTANRIASEKFLYVEPITMVGIIFLAMSLIASYLLRRVEGRFRL